MSYNIFRSKSDGSMIGFTHLRRNISGYWYWQFWLFGIHLVISNVED
jgi:hypothetical protein